MNFKEWFENAVDGGAFQGKNIHEQLEMAWQAASAPAAPEGAASELPEPEVLGFDRFDNDIIGYTAEQFRAYRKACAAQATEAFDSLRADVLHGVDGLDNDQINTVLGMIDYYAATQPIQVAPAVAAVVKPLQDHDILALFEVIKDEGNYQSLAFATDKAILAFARAVLQEQSK